MLLICEDHNENARFTQGTQSEIHFPGRSNNSLWVCLCSDFNLWALRSCWRTLMFCLNESTVLLDTAPPVNRPPPLLILSPAINTAWVWWYRISEHILRKATIFFFFEFCFSNFVNHWKEKIRLLLPAVPYLSKKPFDVWGCMWASNTGLVFVTLQPCNIQYVSLYVGCPFRAWCLLEPGQRQQPPTHFYHCIFFVRNQSQRALHTVQACNLSDLIQTRSKAYRETVMHS